MRGQRKAIEYGITQLASGKYWVRLRGKAIGTFTSLEQARKRRDAVIKVMHERTEAVRPSGGVTLDQIFAQAHQRRIQDGLRNAPTDKARWVLHVSPYVGNTLARHLTVKDVRELMRVVAQRNATHRCKIFRDEHVISNEVRCVEGVTCSACGAQQRRLAFSTKKQVLNLLRVVLEYGVQEEIIDSNVARTVRIKRDRITEQPIFFLTPTQQAQLLDAVPLPQRWIIEVAMFTGLRLGELNSLELNHVHLDADQSYIEVRYGGPGRLSTKVGKPRDVPLLPPALAAMRSWLAQLATWCPKNKLGLVFPTPRGAHRGRKPPRGWKRWLAAANLERRLRFHDLRHTCASALLNGQLGRTWSFEIVGEMLGHADIATTQIYAKLMSSTLMRAAKETTMNSVVRNAAE